MHERWLATIETSVTLLVDIQRGSKEALQTFYTRYAPPTLAYYGSLIQRWPFNSDAGDLTQEFFLNKLVVGNLADRYLRARDSTRGPIGDGQFRKYYKAALWRFYRDKRRASHRGLLGMSEPFTPVLESVVRDARHRADIAFERKCLAELVDRALRGTRETYAGTQTLEAFLLRYLPDDGKSRSWIEIGTLFGWDNKTALRQAAKVKRWFQDQIKLELFRDCGSEPAAERALQRILQRLDRGWDW